MPHNILMSKIRCYNPNKSHSALKNSNYIVYIGTRPGVDLTDVNLDKLTALTEEYIKPAEPSNNNQYIHYIAKRQNSQGLFGNFEFRNITDAAHEVRNVTDAGVSVFRGIVSLSEEDAIELGYTRKENWVSYMNSVMNDVGERFGIPVTSLKWCAAVHMEQGHPHCHYTFWRTDGKVMSPYIHVSKQNEIREFLSGEMFKAEREMLIPEKNKHRDATINATRSVMDSLATTNFNHIPERITQQQLQPLLSDLIELVSSLPGKGSLKYKFLPLECKVHINKAVDDIIQIPAVNKEYKAYIKAASDISKTYSGSEKHQVTNKNIADEDIRTRLANSILKSAATLSLIQQQALSDELSSSHNDNGISQVNSVHLYNEESPQMDSVKLSDDEFFRIVPDYINDENLSQVNSVHLYNDEPTQIDSAQLSDDEFFQMAPDYINDDDFSQVNSVHPYDEVPSQIDSAQLSDDEFFQIAPDYINDDDFSQVNSVHSYNGEHSQMDSAQLSDDEFSERLKSLNDAANRGNRFAKVTLANFYSDMDNELHDIDKAISLYKDCADNDNDSFSMFRLGSLLIQGKNVEKDVQLGLQYLNNAANGGNRFAKVTLANFYSDMDNELHDINKAISLYKDCADNDNDSFSMFRLGSIYLFGHGVPKNEELGLYYLNNAVKHGSEYATNTLEFYNRMKNSIAVSASFSLVSHFLNSLNDHRNQNYLLHLNSKCRSNSKEARIDAYNKNHEHSSLDFEHE